MKKFLASQFLKFSSMKVTHSIPGRVRFSIPGLKHIDKNMLHFEEELVELLEGLNGVDELSLSPISGKALVKYDQSIVDEKMLLNRIKFTWDKMINEIMKVDASIEVTDELVRSFKPSLESIIDEVNKGA